MCFARSLSTVNTRTPKIWARQSTAVGIATFEATIAPDESYLLLLGSFLAASLGWAIRTLYVSFNDEGVLFGA
mgnify:CR=1 FL=1